MTLQLEEDLTRFLGSGERPAEEAARELIVLGLYGQRRISSGKAAELLGVSKFDFVQRASSSGIPYIDLDAGELGREIAEARTIDRI